MVVCCTAAGGGLPDFERCEPLLEAEDAEPESLSDPDDEPLLLLSLLESLSESVLASWKLQDEICFYGIWDKEGDSMQLHWYNLNTN